MYQDVIEPQGARLSSDIRTFGFGNPNQDELEPPQHQEPADNDDDGNHQDAEFQDAMDNSEDEGDVGDVEDDKNSDEEPDAEKRWQETWSEFNQRYFDGIKASINESLARAPRKFPREYVEPDTQHQQRTSRVHSTVGHGEEIADLGVLSSLIYHSIEKKWSGLQFGRQVIDTDLSPTATTRHANISRGRIYVTATLSKYQQVNEVMEIRARGLVREPFPNFSGATQ